jgi:hypothetical protein
VKPQEYDEIMILDDDDDETCNAQKAPAIKKVVCKP